MSGHTTLEGETPKTIQKPKTIKPTGVNTVRLFYAMNNESDEKADIQTGTIEPFPRNIATGPGRAQDKRGIIV